MTGLDSLSKFVLGNVKLPSERADHIIPFLRQLRSDYGSPIACVNDMGTGICKAVAEVFLGIRDYICHFHFLRDVGKDLIGPAHAQLILQLRPVQHIARLIMEKNRSGREASAEGLRGPKKSASGFALSEFCIRLYGG